jgi:hypothetical protein
MSTVKLKNLRIKIFAKIIFAVVKHPVPQPEDSFYHRENIYRENIYPQLFCQ